MSVSVNSNQYYRCCSDGASDEVAVNNSVVAGVWMFVWLELHGNKVSTIHCFTRLSIIV